MERETQLHVILTITAGLKWPYTAGPETLCRPLLNWLFGEHFALYSPEQAMLMAREVILAQYPTLAGHKPEAHDDHYEWCLSFKRQLGASALMLRRPSEDHVRQLRQQFPSIGRVRYAQA